VLEEIIENSITMENDIEKKGMSILECMNRIVLALREDKLSQSFLERMDAEVSVLCQKFSISPMQSVLMSAIAEESGISGHAMNRNLLKLLNVTNLEMALLYPEIEELSRKHIVRIISNERLGSGFQIYEDAVESMMSNSSYESPTNVNIGTEEIFSRMRNLFYDYFKQALLFDRLVEELESLVDNNPESVFCRKVKESKIMDTFCFPMFMYMFHRVVSHGENSVSVDKLIELLGEECDEKRIERHIKNEEIPIQKKHLVEFCADDGFVDSGRLCLCESTIREYLPEIKIEVTEQKSASTNVKDHELIPQKTLYFNSREEQQFGRISRLLSEENYRQIKSRLQAEGMRPGINVLFYGAPGTGKTECCLQLARMTGRDVLDVDVSKLRSKWFGDSEKAVRALFSEYRNLVRQSKRVPILLFNEADAIFGVRMENAEKSVDKINNTIQNIILMEMESMEGIMIATTNLETSLDPAFDRRFLYKMHFGMPEQKTRQWIWKSMLPDLSDSECEMLGDAYEFSGGQIENITRKSMIEYIIDGDRARIDDITKFCEEEQILRKNQRAKIGFNIH